jgi:hypothetical protein
LYGAEIWSPREVDQKYLENLELYFWRRIEKIIWNDREENKYYKESRRIRISHIQ